MAKDIIIRGNTYLACPEVDIPLANGNGTAKFTDTSDATLSSGSQLRNGVTAYDGNGTKITGSMTEKASATYTPTTSNQVINANQYLTGVQTIEGDANLVSSNIVSGISIFGVNGSVQVPIISQDATTKILSIS